MAFTLDRGCGLQLDSAGHFHLSFTGLEVTLCAVPSDHLKYSHRAQFSASCAKSEVFHVIHSVSSVDFFHSVFSLA